VACVREASGSNALFAIKTRCPLCSHKCIAHLLISSGPEVCVGVWADQNTLPPCSHMCMAHGLKTSGPEVCGASTHACFARRYLFLIVVAVAIVCCCGIAFCFKQIFKSLCDTKPDATVVHATTQQAFQMTVPNNMSSGMMVQLQAQNGAMFTVEIPQGLQAGQTFSVIPPNF